jgi:hypothetical protein
MKFPCRTCVVFPRCLNMNLFDAGERCELLKSFIRKRKGLTYISRDTSEYNSFLGTNSKNEAMIIITCLHP